MGLRIPADSPELEWTMQVQLGGGHPRLLSGFSVSLCSVAQGLVRTRARPSLCLPSQETSAPSRAPSSALPEDPTLLVALAWRRASQMVSPHRAPEALRSASCLESHLE